MSAIDKALKKCEKLSDEERITVFVDSYNVVLNAFSDIRQNEQEGFTATLKTILLAMAADGKFNSDEYSLLATLIKHVTDKVISYEDAKSMIESLGSPDDYIETLKHLFSDLMKYSEEAAVSFAVLIITVLAIDGDVSYKEKKWFKKIF